MTLTEVLVGLAILVGVIGVIVPVLPGALLVVAAVLVWSWTTGGTVAWLTLAIAVVLVVSGQIVKYAVPGRRLKEAGIPASTQWTGVAVGVVGFFVIPVIGLFIGFVLGVYLAERRRLGAEVAWPSTRAALRAVGLSILIELVSVVAVAGVWVVGVVVT